MRANKTRDAIVYKGVKYTCVRKDVALRALRYNGDRKFFVVGSGVPTELFFNLATFATNPNTFWNALDEGRTPRHIYDEYRVYMTRSMGRYPVFYVEEVKV
jgi:hypothetical protein